LLGKGKKGKRKRNATVEAHLVFNRFSVYGAMVWGEEGKGGGSANRRRRGFRVHSPLRGVRKGKKEGERWAPHASVPLTIRISYFLHGLTHILLAVGREEEGRRKRGGKKKKGEKENSFTKKTRYIFAIRGRKKKKRKKGKEKGRMKFPRLQRHVKDSFILSS